MKKEQNKINDVYQYDLKYNLIRKWDNLMQITKMTKYKYNALHPAVMGTHNTAYKHIWSLDADLKPPIENNDHWIIEKEYFTASDVFDYPDDKEYWKDVKGFETRYKVSNHGNVFSKQLNKLFSLNKNKDYLRVKLSDENNKTTFFFFVHKLVAEHFIEKHDENHKYVNHKDHNKHNNNYKNLEWTTLSQNSQAYHDHSKAKRAVLQFDKDNNLIKEWTDISEIAEKTDYKRTQIQKLVAQSKLSKEGYIWKYKETKIIKVDERKYKDEEWKDLGKIDDREFSIYSVSNYARIKNTVTNKILQPSLSTTGYYVVCIKDVKKNRCMYKVHRLCAIKFCSGRTDERNIVNHINENKLDNHYKNLEWLTNTENITHSTGRKINQIDIESGKILATFNSIASAAKKLEKDPKIAPQLIGKVCQNKEKVAYGYKWQYVT